MSAARLPSDGASGVSGADAGALWTGNVRWLWNAGGVWNAHAYAPKNQQVQAACHACLYAFLYARSMPTADVWPGTSPVV